MNPETKLKYEEAIKRELEELIEARFTGNIEFRVNFKEGSIANVNFGLNKSIKF